MAADGGVSLYDDAFVWDAHCGVYPRPDHGFGFLDRYREAGVDYLSVNVAFDVVPWPEGFRVIAALRSHVAGRPDELVLAETVDDVLAARAAGKLALTFDLEGMDSLCGDPAMIEVYRRLGVRQILFAYNRTNAFAGGCHDDDPGLTALGRRAVEEMNRLGILVDCSHTGRRSTLEAMALSQAPVVFSHSNAVALQRHGRNIDDEQIRACAATGGVVGINGLSRFLGDDAASTEAIARHLAHVADLVGAEHAGIGLDTSFEPLGDVLAADPAYWPPEEYPPGAETRFAQPAQLRELPEALARHGFGEDEVRGVLGENFLRVARAVWR